MGHCLFFVFFILLQLQKMNETLTVKTVRQILTHERLDEVCNQHLGKLYICTIDTHLCSLHKTQQFLIKGSSAFQVFENPKVQAFIRQMFTSTDEHFHHSSIWVVKDNVKRCLFCDTPMRNLSHTDHEKVHTLLAQHCTVEQCAALLRKLWRTNHTSNFAYSHRGSCSITMTIQTADLETGTIVEVFADDYKPSKETQIKEPLQL